MSTTVEVCLKYPKSLEELKDQVENIVGMPLPHYESGGPTRRSFYGKLLTIDVDLSTNYLETDGELNFSDFQYVLSTRVAGHALSNELRNLQVPITDLIGRLFNYYLGVEVMVTIDVQRLVARYH